MGLFLTMPPKSKSLSRTNRSTHSLRAWFLGYEEMASTKLHTCGWLAATRRPPSSAQPHGLRKATSGPATMSTVGFTVMKTLDIMATPTAQFQSSSCRSARLHTGSRLGWTSWLEPKDRLWIVRRSLSSEVSSACIFLFSLEMRQIKNIDL